MFYRAARRLALVASLSILTMSAEASMQHRMSAENLAPLSGPLKLGAKLKVASVPLIDGEAADLELERFQVWADNAEIKVFGANEEVLHRLAPPAAQYYRGRVAGQPDSLVFLSVTGKRVDGLIYAADRKFAIGTHRASLNNDAVNVVIEESSAYDDIPLDGQGFNCAVEQAQLRAPGGRPRAITNGFGEPVSDTAPVGTQRSVINLAVDTDYELFQKAANSQANVTTFIGNLIAAVSTIYERDLNTEIRIAYIGIQNSSSDPFAVVPGTAGATSLDALLELGDRWALNPPSANVRSAATLVSGKSESRGIAWVGTLCQGSFAYDGHFGGHYSYNGGIVPNGDMSVLDPDANPGYAVSPGAGYWPVLQVAHELGHNVGSDHTHCIALTAQQKIDYGVSRNFIDECYSGEAGCFSGTQLVPAEKGSIMSYCHLRAPGYGTNTRFTFGKAGETSQVALNGLIADMAGKTPAMSAITAPASLNANQTGAASVTNAGLTYGWTITNGTFTGGGTTASGASVSFSGTANPVLLTVTATNGSGCSVTDAKSVTINTVVLIAPQNLVATPTAATSIGLTWSSIPDATGYEIFRAGGGQAYASIGTSVSPSYSDTTAVAGVAYLYKVRGTVGAATGPFSNIDLATAGVFTDPTLTAGSTKVKLAHYTELLNAINAVRTLAGLPALSFTAPAPATSVSIRRVHVLDLRNALDAPRMLLGLPTLTYTDATITAGSTKVKAVHLTELRNGVR
jgi:hypothetical protein